MSAEKFYSEIAKKYRDENPQDIVMMIEILAEERAKAIGLELSNEIYEFAGIIICVIFAPLKLESYMKEMGEFRSLYRGISESELLQESFRNSITQNLIYAEDANQAIKKGVSNLFVVSKALSYEEETETEAGAEG